MANKRPLALYGGTIKEIPAGDVVDPSVVSQSVQTQNAVSVQGSTGAITFVNSNGITFGGNNHTITASHNGLTSQSVQTQSNVQGIVAGTQTGRTGDIVFSNANGVSFGLSNSSVVTASVANAVQTTQSAIKAFGASNTGNTAGNTGLSTGVDWVLAGGNNVTVSQSTAAGGPNTLWISGANIGGAQTGISSIVVSNTTYTSGQLSLKDGNGVSWASGAGQAVSLTHDLQYTSNTSAITSNALNTSASRVINAVVATDNTGGGNASLSGNISFSNANDFSFYTSAGNAIVGSFSQSVDTGKAGTGFTSNGVNIGLSGTLDTNGLQLSATVPAQTNSSWSVSDNNTSGTVARLAFTNLNGVTLSLSTGAAGLHTIVGSHNAITSQSVDTGKAGTGFTSAGNNIGLSGTLNTNGFSLSATAPSVTNSSWTLSDVNTSVTVGRLAFTNSNGLTLSLSTSNNGNHTLIGSYTVPTVTNSSMTVSDANTSGTLGRLAFTNLNGVTLSLSTGAGGSHTIVGSHNAITSVSVDTRKAGTGFTSAGNNIGLSGTLNTNGFSLSATVAAQTNQSAVKGIGVSNTGNTSGNTGVSTGVDWVFAGSNNITLSQSTAGGGPNTIWVSGPSVAGAQTGISGIQVSNTTYTSGTVTFQNANGISFGSSGAQGISASYTVPTVTNSSWSVSDAVTSGTVGRLAFTNLNGVTLSLSTGAGGSHTIVGSHNALTVQTNQSAIKGFGASNTGNTAGNTGLSTGVDWVLAGSNNITVSQSTVGGGPNTLWVSGPSVAGAQTGISGLVLSNTTYTSGTASFRDGNGISFASTTGQGISITHGLQFTSNTSAITSNALNTSVSRVINIVAATDNTGGGTTSLSSNVSFSNANNMTFYTSAGGAIVGSFSQSVDTRKAGTGFTSAGANISFSGTLNTNGLSLSGSVAAQSAQTLSFVGTGNTTQGSTTTLDARSLTVRGAGNVSAGFSNGSIVISGAAGANVNFSAGTTSGNIGSVVFSDSNSVSFGLNGSTITASIPAISSLSATGIVSISTNGSTISIGAAQSDQTLGIFATGNTTQNSSGTVDARSVTFRATGGISIGTSNGSIVFSAATGGAGGGVVLYDGANSISTGTARFSNANGISFGFNGQTITGSVPATSSLSATGAVSISVNGSTVSIGAPAQTTQSAIKGFGASNTGNTAGNTGISTGIDWVLAGSNNITVSQSTVGGGPNTLWVSGPTAGAAITVSDNATSGTIGRLAFTNLNGITLSLSTGAGGSHTIVGSHNALTSQSTDFNAITLGGNTAGTTTFNATNNRSIFLNGGNGITLSGNGSTITISGITQSNQSAIKGLGASNTGNTAGNTGLSTGIDWVIAGSNNITISQSTAGGGPNTLWVSGPSVGGAQTGISGIQISDTTYTSGTVTFRNANGISFGSSGAQGISASYTVPTVTNSSWTVSDNGTSGTVARLAFTNLNGVTLSLSTGAAGSHTIVGSHNALTSQSNPAASASNGSFAFQTIAFSNANNVTFGTSAGSIITASVAAPGAAAEANAINLLGANTSGNTTATGSTIGWSGINLTLSGTNNSIVNISAPATSSLSGTGLVSISTNGSTVFVGVPGTTLGSYENMNNGIVAASALTLNGASASQGVAFIVPLYVSASILRIPALMTFTNTTIATLASASATASAQIGSTWNAVIYSLGTGASSRSLISVASGSNTWLWSQQISITNSTQGSYSMGFTGNAGGSTTTLTTQYSISNTNYSFSSNAFSNFSSGRMLDIPFSSSLTPGAYWLILGNSTSSASGGAALGGMTAVAVKYSGNYGISQINAAVAIMGSSNVSSGGLLGAGSFSTAGGGTTSALPISAISTFASQARPYFQLLLST